MRILPASVWLKVWGEGENQRNVPPTQQEHEPSVLGLSITEQRELPSLQRGEGLWRIGERAFVVRHLCTPGELDLFDTDQRFRGKGDGFPSSRITEPEGGRP